MLPFTGQKLVSGFMLVVLSLKGLGILRLFRGWFAEGFRVAGSTLVGPGLSYMSSGWCFMNYCGHYGGFITCKDEQRRLQRGLTVSPGPQKLCNVSHSLCLLR